MAFDWGEAKTLLRQTVHDTMQRPAQVVAAPGSDAVALTVRWHGKMGLFGDLNSEGYAQYIDTIDRLVFNRPELALLGVSLTDKSVVSFDFTPTKLKLDTKQPYDGPVEEIWTVVRV